MCTVLFLSNYKHIYFASITKSYLLNNLIICYISSMIKSLINKLILKDNLDEIETKEAFDEIFSGLADEITASSFITALEIKNETMDEIIAAILSSREFVNKISLGGDLNNFFESVILVSDDGYFDIKLAVDLICSANSLGVLRYTFNNCFEKNKSFELLKLMGVRFENSHNIIRDFERLNFGYFVLGADEKFYKYSNHLSRSLEFDNILKILEKMLNPYCAKNQIIGLNDKQKVEFFANIALRLNNSNTIVLSGNNSFPYVCPSGETYVAEAWKNKIFTYVLTPELLGFKEYPIVDLICSDYETNASELVLLLQNKLQGAKKDCVILNAALALYISKKANSIMDGIEIAKKTIENGSAYDKFIQIKNTYNE